MRRISKKDAHQKMLSSNGVIFGVKFIKKNHKERLMSCRLGVKKHLTGMGLRYTPFDYGLIGVYDMNNGYRMVNLETLLEVSFNGVRWAIDKNSNL